jgi:hypothetical protein
MAASHSVRVSSPACLSGTAKYSMPESNLVRSRHWAPKFTWFSGPYLKAQAETAGFTDVWSTRFTYQRPISGPCERVIVTARS